jgi:hypothetical protein
MHWNEPYLETCCRAALHRLFLSGASGRPNGLKDGGCLRRLEQMGFARLDTTDRYLETASGRARHRQEILHIEPDSPPSDAPLSQGQ